VSGGHMSTHLDVPYAQQPKTRAAAIRVVSREEGAQELLMMLGLVDDDRPTVGGRPTCPTCGRPRPTAKTGGYRPCQRDLCSGGAS
jgi:hypothetical protein